METGSSGLELRFHVEVFSAPPPYLPAQEDGGNVPLEIVALRDFLDARTRGEPAPVRAAQDGQPAPGPFSLPTLSRSKEGPLRFTLHIETLSDGPQVHILATGHILGRQIDVRIVLRPALHYTFVASYVTLPDRADGAAPRSNCYSVRTEALDLDVPIEDTVLRVVKMEVDDLVGLRRGPGKPSLGNLRHIIDSVEETVADGAVTQTWSGKTSTIVITIDEARSKLLDHESIQAIRKSLHRTVAQLPSSRGRKASLQPSLATEAHRALLDPSRGFLESLPSARWPGFNRQDSLLAHLRKYFQDDGTVLPILNKWLWSRRRRPSCDELAQKIIAIESGLTTKRVGQLIGK